MSDFRDLATCFELSDELIEQALAPSRSMSEPSPRERVLSLLSRAAEVARPRQGAVRILIIYARIAHCDWMEGELEVELYDRGDEGVEIVGLCDDGLSAAPLHKPFLVAAPMKEFMAAISRKPEMLLPLQAFECDEPGVVILAADEAEAPTQDAVDLELFTQREDFVRFSSIEAPVAVVVDSPRQGGAARARDPEAAQSVIGAISLKRRKIRRSGRRFVAAKEEPTPALIAAQRDSRSDPD